MESIDIYKKFLYTYTMITYSDNSVTAITQEVTEKPEKPQYDFSKVDALLVKIQILHYRKIPYASFAKMFSVSSPAIVKALDDQFPGRRILEGIARWLVSTGTPYERLVPHECKVNIGVPDDQE